MTAVGKAAGTMISGSTGVGGLPMEHERMNPQTRMHGMSEIARFNAVMDLLEARNQMLGLLASPAAAAGSLKRV